MKYLYFFFLVISLFAISCPSSDDSAELTKPDIDVREAVTNVVSLFHKHETTRFYVSDMNSIYSMNSELDQDVFRCII